MKEKKKSTILVVDDSEVNTVILAEILRPDYIVHTAADGEGAVRCALEHLPDVILLDVVMDGMDGYEVLSMLKNTKETQNTPVIFITGLSNEKSEELGLVMGAADYITKPFSPTIVKLRVQNQVKMVEQLREIERLSMYDMLTGLNNRRSFDVRFSAEWGRAKRVGEPLSVLMVAIDDFKDYNDANGHSQGDAAVKFFSELLTRSFKRASDFSARWNSGNFVVLLPNTDSNGAKIIGENIRSSIEGACVPCLVGVHDSDTWKGEKITVSIGISTRNKEDVFTAEEMLLGAEKALGEAVRSGKNRVCSHSPNVAK